MATQAERRAATRHALLEAAADVLVAGGLDGFTTSAVTDLAEMSNGALFGHFPTRLDLLAATLEHVLVRLRSDYEQTFSGLFTHSAGRHVDDDVAPDPETALELLWAAMSDPQFRALLEIYTRARTDTELAAAITPIIDEHSVYVNSLIERVATSIAVSHAAVPRLIGIGNLAILAMQGLAVRHASLPTRHIERDVIDGFATMIRSANTEPPPETDPQDVP